MTFFWNPFLVAFAVAGGPAAPCTMPLAGPGNVWAKFGVFCQNPFFGRKSTFLAHFWAEKTGEFFSIFSPFSLRFSPPSAGPTRAPVNSPKIPDSGRLSGRNWPQISKFDPHFRLLRRLWPPGKWGSNFGDFRRLPLLRSPRNSAGGRVGGQWGRGPKRGENGPKKAPQKSHFSAVKKWSKNGRKVVLGEKLDFDPKCCCAPEACRRWPPRPGTTRPCCRSCWRPRRAGR